VKETPPVVVITDNDHGHIAPEKAVLADSGAQLRLLQTVTAQDVIDEASDATILVNQYTPITADVLAALSRCKLVVRYGVGVDNVDVAAATARGIWVANVPDYGTEEVADHAIALAMSLLRGTARLDRSVHAGGWDYTVTKPLRRLSTLTFGVVGCGAIGTATARRAKALGMRVVGVDVKVDRARSVVDAVHLDELLMSSDVVSLHASLDERSRHLIDAGALKLMKPTAYLVNTARGGLVDSAALVEALHTGQIAGAALDVVELEPPTGIHADLVRHPNVVATPHAAWYSEESFTSLKTEVAREALRVLHGQRPRSPVNAPQGAVR
jgi:D-3-phosphoglycerate dehydrogenase